jgi:polyhydroxybutyrate depolymerase
MANFNPNHTSRVYVTGASNGGAMTYRLGCETSGVIAGIAPVIANSPKPIFDAGIHQESLAFLSINGSDDPFIPIAMADAADAEYFRYDYPYIREG